MEEILNLVGSYGFPIVMCVWFMYRTEKIITANTKATEELGRIITTHFQKEN